MLKYFNALNPPLKLHLRVQNKMKDINVMLGRKHWQAHCETILSVDFLSMCYIIRGLLLFDIHIYIVKTKVGIVSRFMHYDCP